MQKRQLNSLMLPWPTDWDDFFGIVRPLIVEIGFGNGDHLVALAQAHPDCHVVGVEISVGSMERAERKLKHRQLTNAVAIHSRGETALHHLLQPNSVQQFHINYPDPWFKTRHAGRRLIQRDTLDALVSRLEVGGLLYLATDIREYAEMSDELLQETSGLSNEHSEPWANEMPERLIVTKYEQKGFREGRVGHYFKYRRNDTPAPHIPVQEEYPMPHVILKTPQSPQDIAAHITKTSFHQGDMHVALLDGYWNPRFDSLLLEVVIEEATIDQHVGLALRQREDGTYTLRYISFGMPRPTDGLHFATSSIGQWLVDLHEEAELISDKTRYAK